MNKILKYSLLSNFWRIKVPNVSINRLKHDFFESDEQTNKKDPKTLKESKNKLLEKILSNKNEAIKVQMFKSYIKMNPDSRWKAVPINYLLKSKVKKDEKKNVQKNKCREVIVSCPPPKQTEQTEHDDSSPSKTPSFSRPKRGEPGEVIWGFIPKQWATFFVPITGHSGFYTFLFTFCTYLFSKEKYVCDHEYYNGISIIILLIYIVKSKGPYVARYLDKEIDNFEKEWNDYRDQMKQYRINAIDTEKKMQDNMEGQLSLIEAKRENVHLQREAEYRKRQMEVYENVKRILDYQVDVEHVRRNIQHKNLIQWVTKEVEKSLTPELKDQYLQLCLADIENILKDDKGEKGSK